MGSTNSEFKTSVGAWQNCFRWCAECGCRVSVRPENFKQSAPLCAGCSQFEQGDQTHEHSKSKTR
jgi:hypothetical protein